MNISLYAIKNCSIKYISLIYAAKAVIYILYDNIFKAKRIIPSASAVSG